MKRLLVRSQHEFLQRIWSKSQKRRFLGYETGLDTAAIELLDARRRANTKGKHYQALLGRDRLGQKGGYSNERYLGQGCRRFGGS